jgi:hypothetical protein
MISGFESPAILVDYKQNHSLFGWGGNLGKLIQEEKKAVLMENREKESESLIFREIKPNNHFEVYKLNWNPIPYIKISHTNPNEFLHATYPIQPGGYARHLDPTQLKDLNYQKTEMGSGATVEDVTLGLRIIDRQKQPILTLMPVLTRNKGDLMLRASATYADELSEEGDTEIILYRVNAANKTESTKIQSYSNLQIAEGRILDYTELVILSKASNSIGFKLSSLEQATDYVIGLQPVAKDGRKGLVYLSRSFRFTSLPNAGEDAYGLFPYGLFPSRPFPW